MALSSVNSRREPAVFGRDRVVRANSNAPAVFDSMRGRSAADRWPPAAAGGQKTTGCWRLFPNTRRPTRGAHHLDFETLVRLEVEVASKRSCRRAVSPPARGTLDAATAAIRHLVSGGGMSGEEEGRRPAFPCRSAGKPGPYRPESPAAQPPSRYSTRAPSIVFGLRHCDDLQVEVGPMAWTAASKS